LIFDDAIKSWERNAPWLNPVQIEQDLILHAMITVAYSDPFLSEHLAFRGGTCLNKLFWKTPARYSEDLDFVQIRAESIGATIKQMQSVLNPMFELKPSSEVRQNGFRIYYYYHPESTPQTRQRIKVEINTREHFSIAGYQKNRIFLDSSWKTGEADVTTFSIEELLATKLRALYQRRKGRDLFDLWKGRELSPDYSKVASIFLEYTERANQIIHRGHFVKNLKEKMKDQIFIKDIVPLIHPDLEYEPEDAVSFVLSTILPFIPESRSQVRKKEKRKQNA